MDNISNESYIKIDKKISECFLDIPEQSRKIIIDKIEEKISPLVKEYANEIGVHPIDFVVNLRSNQDIKKHTQSLSKSESIYKIILENNDETVSSIEKLFEDLFYKTYFTNEDLNKSLKNAAIALGLGSILSVGSVNAPNISPSLSQAAPSSQISSNKIQSAPQSTFKAPAFGTQPEDSFLHNMMAIESSGGKNIEHKPTKHGASPGDVAMGKWGLMPETVREMYRRYAQKSDHPDLKILKKLNNAQMTEHIKKHPDVELHLARCLANHVLNAQNGNELKSAYSWHYGHNLEPHKIGEKQLMEESVVKYRTLMQGKSLKGNKPASIIMPNAPKFVPKTLPQIKKNEDNFSVRLQNWLTERENKDQELISNTMHQYKDIDNVPDTKKLDETKNDDLNPNDPIDKIKLAINKIRDSKDENRRKSN